MSFQFLIIFYYKSDHEKLYNWLYLCLNDQEATKGVITVRQSKDLALVGSGLVACGVVEALPQSEPSYRAPGVREATGGETSTRRTSGRGVWRDK